jgi:uncharacterized lipoprotein YajG
MVALRKVFVLAAVLMLAGCASSGSSELTRHSGSKLQNDADYMYAVESVARQKGVQVVWINPPSEDGTDYLAHSK